MKLKKYLKKQRIKSASDYEKLDAKLAKIAFVELADNPDVDQKQHASAQSGERILVIVDGALVELTRGYLEFLMRTVAIKVIGSSTLHPRWRQSEDMWPTHIPSGPG